LSPRSKHRAQGTGIGRRSRDEDAAKTLLPQAAAALGPIGCLVNNASAFDNDTVESVTRAGWDRHLAINLRAPLS